MSALIEEVGVGSKKKKGGKKKAAPPLPPGLGGAGAGGDDPLANMTPEQAKEAQEMMIQAYAEYLEGLKTSDPKEYKRVMDDLIAKTPGAMESKMQEQGLNLPDGKRMKDGQVRDGIQAQSIDVTPGPGFVIKTKNTKTESKVFINVCVSEHIKNFSKKVQLMEDGTEQEGVSVPMSVGPPKPDKDAAGKSCVVFDMIVNPDVIADAKEDKSGSFRHFLCQIAIQRIEGKYNTTLDQRYKLPKLKYKGTPTPQRVRKESKPTIEEVDPEKAKLEAAKARVKKKAEAKRKKKEAIGPIEHAKYAMYSRNTLGDNSGGGEGGDGMEGWDAHPVPGEGTVPNPCILDPGVEESVPAQMLLAVNLPRLATIYMGSEEGGDSKAKKKGSRSTRAQVSLSSWYLVVRAHGYHTLEIMLPFPVFHDCEVTFDQTDRVLKIRMTVDMEAMDFDPVLPPTATAEDRPGADPGSKQWLLAQALEDSYGNAPGAKSISAEKSAEDFPEDKFHLLSNDPVGENEVLPEDRFIKEDLISQHYLKQKEDGKRDKLKEHEKRRKEQEDDPNIVRIGYGDENDPLLKMKKKNEIQNEIDKVAKRDIVDTKLANDDGTDGLQNDLIFDLLD